MINQQIIDEFRETTSTTALQTTDEYCINGINIARGKIILDTLQVTGDHNFQEKNVRIDLKKAEGLTEKQLGYNGEYPFANDLLRPVRVELSEDGVSYTPAKFYDMNQNAGSEVVPNISSPHVMFERDSFFIRPLPIADVIGGMHIWYEYRQTDFTISDLAESPETEQNTHFEYVLELAIRWGMKPGNKVKPDWRAELKEIRATRRKYYKNRFKKQNKVSSIYNQMTFG